MGPEGREGGGEGGESRTQTEETAHPCCRYVSAVEQGSLRKCTIKGLSPVNLELWGWPQWSHTYVGLVRHGGIHSHYHYYQWG